MIGLFNFPLRQQPDGTIVSSGPISAPNLQGGLVGRLCGTFGNSIMRQGANPVDACTPTVANQGWLAGTAFALNYQFPQHKSMRLDIVTGKQIGRAHV